MQTQHGDARSFQSLDDTYFVAGQELDKGRVTHNHNPLRQNELDVRTGEVIKVYGNHWDGYLLASSLKGDQIGLVPAFKIERIFKSYNYSSNIKF